MAPKCGGESTASSSQRWGLKPNLKSQHAVTAGWGRTAPAPPCLPKPQPPPEGPLTIGAEPCVSPPPRRGCRDKQRPLRVTPITAGSPAPAGPRCQGRAEGAAPARPPRPPPPVPHPHGRVAVAFPHVTVTSSTNISP